MPKVLRLTNRLNLGGITYNASYLSKYIDDEFETLFLSGMLDEEEESSLFIPESLGLQPVFVKSMFRKISFIDDIKAIIEVINHIKEFEPDIIHTHTSKPGVVGRIAALWCKVPVTVHTFHGHVFHSYFGKVKTEFYRQIEKWLGKFTSKIIAISPAQKYDLVEKYKVIEEKNVEIIRLGFDLDRFKVNREAYRKEFRQKYNLNEEDVAIGIIGRLVPIKNHKLFVETIFELKKISTKNFKAFIIGDGELRLEIENQIEALQLEDSPFVFTSWIKKIEFATNGLDIVCLTSNNEGTPVSLIEASASRKPVVATNVGGVKDVVKQNETGLICDKNPIDLAKSIHSFMIDKAKANQFGKAGEVFINQIYSYKRLAKEVSDLYRKLLTEKE